MENASQALIIAAGILIAIIVLSLGVYLVINYSEVTESYGQARESVEINKFNTNFTKFKDRTNIRAQEIITLNEFVENYKEKNEVNDIEVVPSISDNIEFIKDNESKFFTCTAIEYDTSSGRVKKIVFN